MIPKPPFARDLSPERELEEFRKLQPRLTELWNDLANDQDQPYTSVVVSSLTLDEAELEKLEGAAYYEERLLFLLIRLRNSQARVVYVTSRPVHPAPSKSSETFRGRHEYRDTIGVPRVWPGDR